jgi:hypothetical protein
MQTSARTDSRSDAELETARLEKRGRFWRAIALGSALCTANLFLGIVGAILSQLAIRAARRQDFSGALACVRWARILTLIGVLLFGAASVVAVVLLFVVPRV